MPLGPSWDIKPLPSHKTTKKRPASFDIPLEEPEQDPPFIISNETKDNPHPIDLEEGMLEKLIKYAADKGENFADADRIYLEQYLHPERDIIPKQKLRPTQGGMSNDNLEYRRLPEEPPMKVGSETLKRYPMTDGLGNYTRSKGKDYNSAYDIWDFDSPTNIIKNKSTSPLSDAASWVAKKVMQNVGTPFKVYERYKKDELPSIFDPDYNFIDDNQAPAGYNIPLDEYDKPKKGKK
jgi:hypothetical protein